jgi:hypothetical protein
MERHNRRLPMVQREGMDGAAKRRPKGTQKGHENVPFWVLDGFVEISATLLERMAGTTRLELATSAVTAGYKYFQRHGRARTAL